jgi:hypothetical protein
MQVNTFNNKSTEQKASLRAKSGHKQDSINHNPFVLNNDDKDSQ